MCVYFLVSDAISFSFYGHYEYDMCGFDFVKLFINCKKQQRGNSAETMYSLYHDHIELILHLQNGCDVDGGHESKLGTEQSKKALVV